MFRSKDRLEHRKSSDERLILTVIRLIMIHAGVNTTFLLLKKDTVIWKRKFLQFIES